MIYNEEDENLIHLPLVLLLLGWRLTLDIRSLTRPSCDMRCISVNIVIVDTTHKTLLRHALSSVLTSSLMTSSSLNVDIIVDKRHVLRHAALLILSRHHVWFRLIVDIIVDRIIKDIFFVDIISINKI